MPAHARRDLLGIVGTAIATGLAGCSDGEDPEPGLHAVSVVVLAREGHPEYDPATDRLVRVTVENTDIDRHTGTLVVTVRPAEDDGGSDPPEQTAPVELPGGTTRGYEFVFRNVADGPDHEIEATASIRQP